MATLKLISKTHLSSDVWTFQFEAHPSFTWIAGQFMRVELPHTNPDGEGTKRWFTISAAPFEKNPAISTHVTSTTFKQALVNLPEDGELKLLEQPDGDFIWIDTELPRIFVAAGIGITPFRSMITQRAHDHDSLPVSLMYANRTNQIPFQDEFGIIAAANPEFHVQYVTGALMIPESLQKMAPDILRSMVYISGAEPMVEALGDGLRAAGLPEEQLKQDFFPNYDEHTY